MPNHLQESQSKQIRLVERSRPANFKHDFHRWCKQITMWCKSLRIEKYISFRMKWFFWPPFLSVSPFLLLNLVRRQCYAYAIGLYTRPEIKSWPDVKFCAHAQCVLPRCCFPSVASFSAASNCLLCRTLHYVSINCHFFSILKLISLFWEAYFKD